MDPSSFPERVLPTFRNPERRVHPAYFFPRDAGFFHSRNHVFVSFCQLSSGQAVVMATPVPSDYRGCLWSGGDFSRLVMFVAAFRAAGHANLLR